MNRSDSLKETWERLTWARTKWQSSLGVKPSVRAAAQALAMKEGTYAAYERSPGTSKFTVLDHERAMQFGRKYKVSWVWLLTGEGSPDDLAPDIQLEENSSANEKFQVRMIPLLGDVRAGAFMSVTEQEEPKEWIAFYDPQYERAETFGLKVVGTSMNEYYQDGAIVICARAVHTGVMEGDHVVLEVRDSLGRVETTLKEVQIRDNRVEFWPRSTDERYQTPFIPPHANDEFTDEGWQVTGIVISEYRKRPPRGGRMVSLADMQP